MTECAVIQLRDLEYQVDSGQSLDRALKTLGIQPESVIAIRDGSLIDAQEKIRPLDFIRLVHVISGGENG